MNKKWKIASAILAAVLLVLATLAYVGLHQVHGQYFDSAGVKIHYTDQGSGVPVILVHGYTANSDLNWRLPGILAALQKEYRVITMDVRGHGLSDKPHDPAAYGVELPNDVLRLMDHLKIEKAHLIGYSMGGFITLKFLAMHQDRLYSAMPCGAAWMPPGDPLEKLALRLHRGLMGEHWGTGLFGRAMASLQRGAIGSVMDLEALGALAASFKDLAVTEAELRAVSIPVMAVKGGEEEVVLGGGKLEGVLPGYQETIIPGGHHSSTIFYRGFQSALLDFLRAHTPATKS